MEFSYDAYIKLINILKEHGYTFCDYNDIINNENEKTVIMRHDVDFDLEKAVKLGLVEKEQGIKSTYFILLSTNFYNVFSKSSYERINILISLGHKIGLHFDEKRYDIKSIEDIKKHVIFEAKILSNLLDKQINVVSMHRPSKMTLENDIKFNGIINSYSSYFFKKMKYISDSRMNWREDIIDIISSKKYGRLHILTHPFWYSNENQTMEYKLKTFLNEAIIERYLNMNNNFRNLEEII
jgi:hypothetical protein